MVSPLVVGLVAFVVSCVLTWRLASPHAKLRVLDVPNHRSLHAAPTPKTGGIAVVAGLTCALILAPTTETALLSASLILAGISFWNDLWELPALVRFSLHAIVATVFVVVTGSAVRLLQIPVIGGISVGVLSVPLTVLAIVWMTNLYNFMDGLDGFSGGMTVAGFASLAVAAMLMGHSSMVVISIAVACGAAGFLIHNFPPAKIFLGDVGSIAIGFMAAALGAIGVRDGVFDVWVPVLAFSPFIVDATVTLFRRLLNGEKVWLAHRKHFYQRLVLIGWSARLVVLCEYMVMGTCLLSVSLYMLTGEHVRLAILMAWCLAYLILSLKVDAAVAACTRSKAG